MSRSRAQRASQGAQERLAARRRKEKRRRAAWTAAVAAAVLVVAVLAGVGIWYATRPGDDAAVPGGVTADGRGVPVGDGPVTVEIYLDFICPACKQFHDATRRAIDGYLADGTVTVVYRPIAILDRYSTTRYSTRAAAASGCAADVGMMDEFVSAMMAAQPPEGSAGLPDEQIIEVAAGAGVTDPAFAECVGDEPYRDWVGANTEAAFERGVRGTPTVFVDDARLEELSVAALTAAIDTAAG